MRNSVRWIVALSLVAVFAATPAAWAATAPDRGDSPSFAALAWLDAVSEWLAGVVGASQGAPEDEAGGTASAAEGSSEPTGDTGATLDPNG